MRMANSSSTEISQGSSGGYWTEEEFFGNNDGTGFADVDGDGDSEPIAIKSDGLWVRRNMFKNPPSSCP